MISCLFFLCHCHWHWFSPSFDLPYHRGRSRQGKNSKQQGGVWKRTRKKCSRFPSLHLHQPTSLLASQPANQTNQPASHHQPSVSVSPSVMGAAIFPVKPDSQCWILPQATAAAAAAAAAAAHSPGVVRAVGAVVGRGGQALLGRYVVMLAALAAYGHGQHGGGKDQDGASARQYVIPVGGQGRH